MYDTRSDFCYKTNFVTGSASTTAFGPSTSSYLSGNELVSCGATIDQSSAFFLRTTGTEISDEGITFSALDNANSISYVQFDNIGKPYTSAGTCLAGCTLTFTGDSSAKICIENQGYVHVCE